jgi:tRNA threonylcarbamoyladenosine biosynthesis protein TsaB
MHSKAGREPCVRIRRSVLRHLRIRRHNQRIHFDIAGQRVLYNKHLTTRAMPSLRQLLDTHSTILLIDSASLCVQVALLRQNHEPVWISKTGEAGEQVFAAVNELLTSANLSLDAIDAFIFCDGPGSVLGIRTAAVALRTWRVLRERPVYAFCSLTVIADALVRNQARSNFAVIADARRESWHRVAVDANGTISQLHRLPATELTGALVMPDGFRHWAQLPASVETVPYSLAALLPTLAEADLFYAAAEPDAFLHEEPVYKTWTPQVHRAPQLS